VSASNEGEIVGQIGLWLDQGSKPPHPKADRVAGGRRKTQRPATRLSILTLDQKLDILGIALVALALYAAGASFHSTRAASQSPGLIF